MKDLDGLGYRGKTVVVTGGASGMGEATARFLNELGAKVHIVDIQTPKVAHESFHQCDLSDFDQVRATAAALRELAPIHFLFPCAGLPPSVKGPMYCMRVNYIGTRLFVEELPALEDGAGIALISSDAAMGWQKTSSNPWRCSPFPTRTKPTPGVKPTRQPRTRRLPAQEMLAVWVQNAPSSPASSAVSASTPSAPAPRALPSWTSRRNCCRKASSTPGRTVTGSHGHRRRSGMAADSLNSPLNVHHRHLRTDQGFASGVMTGAIDPKFMSGQL